MSSERESVHRLHPSSLFFNFIRHAKGMIIPVVMVLFFASGDTWELWLGLFLIPAAIYEVYRVLSIRYQFVAGELVVMQGVIFKNERHVPFARIQNIDWTQGVLQRALRVAEVRIETAGGAEPEAVFQVLSVKHIEEMRARVFADRGAAGRTADAGSAAGVRSGAEADLPFGWPIGAAGDFSSSASTAPSTEPASAASAPAAAAGSSRTLLTLPGSELLLLGLDLGRGLARFAVLFGVAWEFKVFEKLDPSTFLEDVLRTAPGSAFASIALTLTLVAGAFVLLLSIVATFLRFHGFTLTRAGDDFRVRAGLFTQRSATIPRHRIQLVSVQESLLHRKLGRVKVKIETAGGGSEEGEGSWSELAPIARRDQVQGLLRQIAPELDLNGVEWQPLAPRARARLLKRGAIIGSLLGLAFGALVRPWGALSILAFVPLGLLHAHRQARFMAYARMPWGVFFRSGAWGRKTSVVLPDKVQVVGTSESPFDRRYTMATLGVDSAGKSRAGHRVHVPYLPKQRAEELRREIAATVQGTGFTW